MGITKSEIDAILMRLKDMAKLSKPDTKQHKTEAKQYKAETLITPEVTIKWGRSTRIQTVRKRLKGIQNNPEIKISSV